MRSLSEPMPLPSRVIKAMEYRIDPERAAWTVQRDRRPDQAPGLPLLSALTPPRGATPSGPAPSPGPGRSATATSSALLRAASLLNAAQREAEEIAEDARRERETLLATARAEAESIRQRAYEEGFALGRQEGEAAARAELEALFARAHHIVQEALSFQERMINQARQELLHLAMAIATKIIGEEIQKPGKVVTKALREALLRYRPAGQVVTVRLSLQDLNALEGKKEEFMRLCQGTREWRLVADERVGPGGCLIETEQGIIDGRVESRLAAVQSSLEELMGQEDLTGSGELPLPEAEDRPSLPGSEGGKPDGDGENDGGEPTEKPE